MKKLELKQLIHEVLNEVLDSPYKYKHTFTTEEIDYEDEETGETYKKDVLSPVQIIRFKTDSGLEYMWYAKQNRYDDTMWEIAFGIHNETDSRGSHQLNIGVTGSGNAFRVLATVIDITNSFIEFDEDNFEIRHIMFTAKGNNRAKLYIKRLEPLIEKFKVDNVRDNGYGETEVIMTRTN